MELYNGDCLTIMRQMPDQSVDLVLTDPPYMIGYKTKRRKDKQHKFCREIAGDRKTDFVERYINECYRLLKENNAAYVFCSSKTVDVVAEMCRAAGFSIKNRIIWVKNNHTAGDLTCQFGQEYEIILLLNKGKAPFRGSRITDVWNYKKVPANALVHPNQKPVSLIERCLQKHSDAGDTVFDGCMGSGTTGVACANTDREFIGIELDNEYFDIAKRRIENASSQKAIAM